MQPITLRREFPELFHVTAQGNWPGIRQHGLMSTARLLDQCPVSADQRSMLLEQRRPRMTTLTSPTLGQVTIRDQQPMAEAKLASALDDMSVGDWLRMLNERVFFWPTRDRLLRLLRGRTYQRQVQDVIVVETRLLVEKHADEIELASINTGSTAYAAARRGSHTFVPLAAYRATALRRIAEVALIGGVPEIARMMLRVESWRGDELLGTTWDRDKET